MKINIISNIYLPVKADSAGGIEVFNYYLSKELSDRGLDVRLFASGDSANKNILKSIVPKSLRSANSADNVSPWVHRKLAIKESAVFLKMLDDYNFEKSILHFSMDNIIPVYLAAKRNLKSIVTFHLSYKTFISELEFLLPKEVIKKNIRFVGVSEFIMKNFPYNYEVIHNGVDTNDFKFSQKYEDSFIWIGRMVAAKGARDAILAITNTKYSLMIAGAPKQADEWEYFNKNIKPLLKGKIEYIGHVDKDKRNDFYHAKALLFLPKWDEPFGLTMIESMACGTPVIAYDKAAVREVLENGKTGFLVPPDDIKALADAIDHVAEISEKDYRKIREKCRSVIEDKFSLKIMVDKYIKLYEKFQS